MLRVFLKLQANFLFLRCNQYVRNASAQVAALNQRICRCLWVATIPDSVDCSSNCSRACWPHSRGRPQNNMPLCGRVDSVGSQVLVPRFNHAGLLSAGLLSRHLLFHSQRVQTLQQNGQHTLAVHLQAMLLYWQASLLWNIALSFFELEVLAS